MNTYYVIVNPDNGLFWHSRDGEFHSEASERFTPYTSEASARRAAKFIRRNGRQVVIREWRAQSRPVARVDIVKLAGLDRVP